MLKVNKSWTDCVGFGQCFVMVTGVHGGNVDRNRAADWHRNPQVHLPGCLWWFIYIVYIRRQSLKSEILKLYRHLLAACDHSPLCLFFQRQRAEAQDHEGTRWAKVWAERVCRQGNEGGRLLPLVDELLCVCVCFFQKERERELQHSQKCVWLPLSASPPLLCNCECKISLPWHHFTCLCMDRHSHTWDVYNCMLLTEPGWSIS